MVLLIGAALGAEEPEAVYARVHAAVLEGELQEMLAHSSGRRRAEIAALAGSPHAALHLVGLMPRSYAITAKSVSPDRRRARLAASGTHEWMGRALAVYGSISLAREGGAWKVDGWEWSNLPPAPPPAPAGREEAAKPKPAARLAARPLPQPAAQPQACEVKPVMSDEDLRRCGAAPPAPYSRFFLP